MKLTKIEVSCTFNAGNYESVKLGGEWEISESDKYSESTQAAMAQIRGAWEHMKAAKVESNTQQVKSEKSAKTLVEFGSTLLQKIVDRIMADKSVTLDVITTHYDLTDDARKVIEAALTLNK